MAETHNNEKKRFGRRAACGFTVLVDCTVAFYFCMLRGVDLY